MQFISIQLSIISFQNEFDQLQGEKTLLKKNWFT
jgi:hypothetical protein